MLRSTPTHFGDFFGILTDENVSKSAVAATIVNYLKSSRETSAVRIDQLRETDPLTNLLQIGEFRLYQSTRSHSVILPSDAEGATTLLITIGSRYRKIGAPK